MVLAFDLIRANAMKPRISMITLGVDDIGKSVTFYRDGYGFAQLESLLRWPSLLFMGRDSACMVVKL
jgi:hypothetical protein